MKVEDVEFGGFDDPENHINESGKDQSSWLDRFCFSMANPSPQEIKYYETFPRFNVIFHHQPENYPSILLNKPVMVIIAGHNGAGKTTLYYNRIRPLIEAPYVNADEIQTFELKDEDLSASYAAAEIAEKRRAELIASHTSFVSETVFSHESKMHLLDDARNAGFTIVMIHVGVNTPELAIERVQHRHQLGGHDVPVDRVVARYNRCGHLIKQAVDRADLSMVFDNTTENCPPKRRLVILRGKRVMDDTEGNDWVSQLYADR
jgi:predicted ABC-type ATPase